MRKRMTRPARAVTHAIRIVFLIALPLSITACSSGDDSDNGLLNGDNDDDSNAASDRACSLDTEKSQILQIMEQWYFWNDEAVQADKYAGINLDDYNDGEDLLNYLRYRPNSRDRGFTHITTPAEEQAFYEEGEYVGFGFSFLRDSSDAIRISQVYDGSPAGRAGIERGYELLAIDGADVQSMSNADVSAALGPPEPGLTRTLRVADRNDTVLPDVELTKDTVTIVPVPVATVIEDGGGNPIAGYLVLGTFIGPAEQALRDAFADFNGEGVNTLIVDLRYNGGGRVDVAATFASLLAGPGNAGQVFIDFEYNSDRAADNNFRINFSSENNAIDLDTIVFITTNFSASASELVISGLEPYFDTAGKELAGVGTSTFGKPVGQSAFDFCNDSLRLRAVTFKSVNADGEGEYYDGLPVACTVGDDLEHPFGSESESMLSVALDYIDNGTCPLAAGGQRTIAAQSGGAQQQVIGGPYPWQRYAGAH